MDIITRDVSTGDLKDAVNKLIPDAPGQDIERACQSIYPLHDVFIRKFKVLKEPKFDLGKLMDMHGEGASHIPATTWHQISGQLYWNSTGAPFSSGLSHHRNLRRLQCSTSTLTWWNMAWINYARVSVRNRTLMKKSPHPPTLPRQRGYPYLNADKTSRGILNNCRLTVGRLSVAESCSSVTD